MQGHDDPGIVDHDEYHHHDDIAVDDKDIKLINWKNLIQNNNILNPRHIERLNRF